MGKTRKVIAPIESKYIIRNKKRFITEVDGYEDEYPSQSSKNQKLNTGKKKKNVKDLKKKWPQHYKPTKETEICASLVDKRPSDSLPIACHSVTCTGMHSIPEYLEQKPPDIGSTCYIYSVRGHCRYGLSCRFGSGHITPRGRNMINYKVMEEFLKSNELRITNKLKEKQLKSNSYNFEKADKIVESVQEKIENRKDNIYKWYKNPSVPRKTKASGCITDEDIIAVRPEEKKKIDWEDKLYMAPLSTLGNVPFRRICYQMGVDITCGPMALAASLLKASVAEWGHLKRHGCESIFGVQLCGSVPATMARCVQLLEEETDVDFIDLNLGCPIGKIYKQGLGSGLLNRQLVLEKIVRSMVEVTTLPITVKLRTGCFIKSSVAHNLTPKFRDWGVSLITLHGLSREHHFYHPANWSYIEHCAKLCKPTPLFGNGDIFSYEDYEFVFKKYPSVSGAMIGRAALIKPWIFTEIKERRHWDISSTERLNILRKFVNYGLDVWGSSSVGVEKTRWHLLEWLSFLYRYIPVGLLERIPQSFDQRPPDYKGRDKLETLMASPDPEDWIKISEMFLGPIRPGVNFVPTHKARSWK